MVFMGRLPFAFAPGAAERRLCSSGGERRVELARDWDWLVGVWVSESEGEESIWLSPSLSADILIREGWVGVRRGEEDEREFREGGLWLIKAL